MFQFQITIEGRKFAADHEGCGVFRWSDNSWVQQRGTLQTPVFKSARQFERYVRRHVLPPREEPSP